ncbi:hypothetical protein MKW98_012593 [Papaver atlanticum]|uniref:Uncharacterized protein n=1 Tax=Papaver atlanticum TaxID=357466 RepID=A0AAD4T2C8_9MAGN|nr:hypothetical protein MKW98_012593 [Papaver atlanticum]
MGKEFEYAVGFLASLKRIKTCGAVTNSSSNSTKNLNKRLLIHKLASADQNQHYMDRLLEQYDKEYVRTTMLKQEEIFKEQVHELHRLYVVQKTLMIEFKMNKSRGHSKNSPSPRTPVNPDHQPRVWPTMTGFETNNCHFTNTNNSGHTFHHLFSARAEPINSQEQSSTSFSRDNVKMHKDFDLESPVEEFSRGIGRDQIGSSSITSSKEKLKVESLNEQHLYTEGESEVELSLSIGLGNSTNNKKKKQENCQSISPIYLHTNHKYNGKMDSSLSIKDLGAEDSTSGSSKAAFNQESLQKPPWYFQTLSLNRS